jgi:alkanesulfonate monooxygenase SsuD/methylene tetrahydromethanopterin reductase-like flavin-dependent oxidoreductase (luciferase family)
VRFFSPAREHAGSWLWHDHIVRHGVVLPNFDLFGEATVMVELARLAEASGWDGFFIWDHLEWPGSEPAVDPWVALGAVAVSTERIRLGTMITPLPRRDVAKLARETVSVDRLSAGRFVLSVGLGWEGIPEWGAFGHERDRRVRGEMLDEGLEVLTALWTGDPFYSGDGAAGPTASHPDLGRRRVAGQEAVPARRQVGRRCADLT